MDFQKSFPLVCTLTTSSPAWMDTWHWSMHHAYHARENAAEIENRSRERIQGREQAKRSNNTNTSLIILDWITADIMRGNF